MLLIAAPTQAQLAPVKPEHGLPRGYDARALQLLTEMADTYAHLPALEQETDFYSTLIPLSPDGTPIPVASREDAFGGAVPEGVGSEKKLPQTFKIRYLAPNRLRMERAELDRSTGDESVEQWISDGHDFWTYKRPKNWYTRDKAPGTLRQFMKVPTMSAGSLEIIMMMGVNPFTNLRDSVESIQPEGTKTVNGVQTDVVTLHAEANGQFVDTRFYIGTTDHLLRRLEIETKPKPAVSHSLGKQGDPLDELVDKAQPAAPQEGDRGGVKMRSMVRYDNLLKSGANLSPADFAFNPPSNASFQQPIERNGKYAQEQMEKQIDAILKQMNQGKSVPRRLLQH
jgi:outer membrane lipoprotein-sorting protein